jgi:hypothetical protein
VQRLFSTFAGGCPGAGLLIQRLLVGAALVYYALTLASAVGAPQVIGAVAGVMLALGLWTPLAGVAAACAEAWIAFSSSDHAGMSAALAVLSATLALIGPGQWSIDGRIYGRKRLLAPDIDHLASPLVTDRDRRS